MAVSVLINRKIVDCSLEVAIEQVDKLSTPCANLHVFGCLGVSYLSDQLPPCCLFRRGERILEVDDRWLFLEQLEEVVDHLVVIEGSFGIFQLVFFGLRGVESIGGPGKTNAQVFLPSAACNGLFDELQVISDGVQGADKSAIG